VLVPDDAARANLEHDLRAPLAVISGYAEALLLRDDDETRLEAARRIQEAVERLHALIDELLQAVAGPAADGGQTTGDSSR
jgi:signal transduction histidine kinase